MKKWVGLLLVLALCLVMECAWAERVFTLPEQQFVITDANDQIAVSVASPDQLGLTEVLSTELIEGPEDRWVRFGAEPDVDRPGSIYLWCIRLDTSRRTFSVKCMAEDGEEVTLIVPVRGVLLSETECPKRVNVQDVYATVGTVVYMPQPVFEDGAAPAYWSVRSNYTQPFDESVTEIRPEITTDASDEESMDWSHGNNAVRALMFSEPGVYEVVYDVYYDTGVQLVHYTASANVYVSEEECSVPMGPKLRVADTDDGAFPFWTVPSGFGLAKEDDPVFLVTVSNMGAMKKLCSDAPVWSARVVSGEDVGVSVRWNDQPNLLESGTVYESPRAEVWFDTLPTRAGRIGVEVSCSWNGETTETEIVYIDVRMMELTGVEGVPESVSAKAGEYIELATPRLLISGEDEDSECYWDIRGNDIEWGSSPDLSFAFAKPGRYRVYAYTYLNGLLISVPFVVNVTDDAGQIPEGSDIRWAYTGMRDRILITGTPIRLNKSRTVRYTEFGTAGDETYTITAVGDHDLADYSVNFAVQDRSAGQTEIEIVVYALAKREGAESVTITVASSSGSTSTLVFPVEYMNSNAEDISFGGLTFHLAPGQSAQFDLADYLPVVDNVEYETAPHFVCDDPNVYISRITGTLYDISPVWSREGECVIRIESLGVQAPPPTTGWFFVGAVCSDEIKIVWEQTETTSSVMLPAQLYAVDFSGSDGGYFNYNLPLDADLRIIDVQYANMTYPDGETAGCYAWVDQNDGVTYLILSGRLRQFGLTKVEVMCETQDGREVKLVLPVRVAMLEDTDYPRYIMAEDVYTTVDAETVFPAPVPGPSAGRHTISEWHVLRNFHYWFENPSVEEFRSEDGNVRKMIFHESGIYEITYVATIDGIAYQCAVNVHVADELGHVNAGPVLTVPADETLQPGQAVGTIWTVESGVGEVLYDGAELMYCQIANMGALKRLTGTSPAWSLRVVSGEEGVLGVEWNEAANMLEDGTAYETPSARVVVKRLPTQEAPIVFRLHCTWNGVTTVSKEYTVNVVRMNITGVTDLPSLIEGTVNETTVIPCPRLLTDDPELAEELESIGWNVTGAWTYIYDEELYVRPRQAGRMASWIQTWNMNGVVLRFPVVLDVRFEDGSLPDDQPVLSGLRDEYHLLVTGNEYCYESWLGLTSAEENGGKPFTLTVTGGELADYRAVAVEDEWSGGTQVMLYATPHSEGTEQVTLTITSAQGRSISREMTMDFRQMGPTEICFSGAELRAYPGQPILLDLDRFLVGGRNVEYTLDSAPSSANGNIEFNSLHFGNLFHVVSLWDLEGTYQTRIVGMQVRVEEDDCTYVGMISSDILTVTWTYSDEETPDDLCGPKASWKLDEETGTLTVSGVGAMYNFETASAAPWAAFADQIVCVRVDAGMTAVGSHAFDSLTALRTLYLPDTLRKIGQSAVGGAAADLEVFFSGPRNSLKNVTIGAGNDALQAAAWHFEDDLEPVAHVLTLPGSLVEIGDEAFLGVNAQMVVLPEGVERIGSRAFANAQNLLYVRIPATVTSIAPDAFAGAPVTILCAENSYAQQWAAQAGFPIRLD